MRLNQAERETFEAFSKKKRFENILKIPKLSNVMCWSLRKRRNRSHYKQANKINRNK